MDVVAWFSVIIIGGAIGCIAESIENKIKSRRV